MSDTALFALSFVPPEISGAKALSKNPDDYENGLKSLSEQTLEIVTFLFGRGA
jgi:hypothetical protein